MKKTYMNEEYLVLKGRVASTNADKQSCVIKSLTAPKRIRVYIADALFWELVHELARAREKGKKANEMLGTFYIQGRVLMRFALGNHHSKTWEERTDAFKKASEEASSI